MAIVYGEFTRYVAEGYVTTGYVEDSALYTAFTTTVTAVLNPLVEAEVSLDAAFTTTVTATNTQGAAVTLASAFTSTQTATNTIGAELSLSALNTFACSLSGLLQDDIAVDSAFTISVEPHVTRSADAEFGLGTTWSAQASPIKATTVALSTAFTTDITADVFDVDIEMSVSFTQDATANCTIVLQGTPYAWDDETVWDEWTQWQNIWDLPAQFTQTVTPVKLIVAEVAMDSAMDFQATIVGQRLGDIDVNSEFTQTLDAENQISATVTTETNQFTTSITGGNIKQADLSLATEFTTDITAETVFAVEIDDFDVISTQTTQAVNNIRAEVSITAWTSEFTFLARPVTNGEMSIASEFTLDVTGFKTVGATERVLNITAENRTLYIEADVRLLLAA